MTVSSTKRADRHVFVAASDLGVIPAARSLSLTALSAYGRLWECRR